MARFLALVAILALCIVRPGSGQIEIGGLVNANHVAAHADFMSRFTPLDPATTSPIHVNHHVQSGTAVAEAVFTKSSTSMFLCVGSWDSAPAVRGARAEVRFAFRNLSPNPIWFSVTGFATHDSPHPIRYFQYRRSATGVGNRTETFVDSEGIRFTDRVPSQGYGYFWAATGTIGAPSFSQIVLDVSIRSSDCTRNTAESLAVGMVSGQGGLPPILSVRGCAETGTLPLGLGIARPNASSLLLVGLPSAGFPVFGGILYPAPLVATIPLVTGPANSMGYGGWNLPVPVPAAFVGQVSLQAFVVDSAAVQGISISNALTLTLH